MTNVDDEELTRFLFGDLPAERLAVIQSLIDSDAEFAARVEVNRYMMGAISGLPNESLPEHPTALKNSLSKKMVGFARRPLVIAALGVLIVATTVSAGWQFINGPLLEDSLTSGWFNSELWLPPPDGIKAGGLQAEKGYLRLVNRGYLRARQEFKEGIDIRFEWKWMQLGLDPLYADHLSIGMRTNGTPNANFFNEVSDGLVVKLNAWAGTINLMSSDGSDLARTPTGRVPMPAEEWHQIRITDDGETICVYVAGPLVQPTADGKPLIEYRHQTEQAGKRFAIYNRELVSFPHVSCLRNLTVRRHEIR